jgi:arylsulfatase A-like enzyme
VIQVEFDGHHVPLEEVMLPEMLDASPWVYQAGAVGKWHLAGYDSVAGLSHPLEQGFGYYAGSYGNPGASTVPGEHPTDYFYWEKVTNGIPAFTERYMTSDTVDEAIEQIQEMTEPWFLYVAFNAPHDPFHLPPEELHSYDIDETATPPERYAAMVEALDTEVGRLLDAVPPEVLARTTILFAGDNGTPEQAITEPLLRTRSKGTLFEGGVNVPMIVSGPLVSIPGSESEGLVHVVDVFATAAEMAGVRVHVPSTGVEASPEAVSLEIDGLSLLPYLQDPNKPSLRRFGYSEKFHENGWGPYVVDVQTVRDNNFKLIRRTSGVEELYDLREDGWDEGPNVLDSEEPGIREAAQRLSQELDLLLERMATSD